MKMDGKRQYKFVNGFNYIREAGTEGEKSAAEQIGQMLEAVGADWKMEPFAFVNQEVKEAFFQVTEPYQKEYRVRGIFNCAGTVETGITAPLFYAEDFEELNSQNSCGAIVLLNDMVTEKQYDQLIKYGAAAFLIVSGTPLDPADGRISKQFRLGKWENNALPGAGIHYVDAAEMVERGAGTGRFRLLPEERCIHSQNVTARVSGTSQPEEIITLTAHYDSVPDGPGAYDNMSGAAIVMELLHYFKEHPQPKTLEFIWFGAEEKGLRGSRAYVEQHAKELKNHIFNMNIDLAGQTLGKNVLGVTAGSEVCDFLKEIMEKNGLYATIKNQVWASDSNTFAWKGIPALTLNRDGYGMHTQYDTIDLISPRALEKGSSLLAALVTELAEQTTLPLDCEIPEEMKKELENYFD